MGSRARLCGIVSKYRVHAALVEVGSFLDTALTVHVLCRVALQQLTRSDVCSDVLVMVPDRGQADGGPRDPFRVGLTLIVLTSFATGFLAPAPFPSVVSP
ncbi:hypothetical protein MTO96_045638 [Rhipicephalus appendiculatus]